MIITEIHEFNKEASKVTVCIATKDGDGVITIGERSIEDMRLFRNLNNASNISDLLHMAYQAGLRGEEYEYQFTEKNNKNSNNETRKSK